MKSTKINAVFVVKDEWPLLALSVSHALLNYAQKAIIIDTGSQDGTFSGIKKLQQIFPQRIDFYSCPQNIFDQAPLANIGLYLSEIDGSDWTVFLDADEWLWCRDFSELRTQLGNTQSNFIGYAIPVINYAPFDGFNDLNLKDFLNVKSRVESVGAYHLSDQVFMDAVLQGKTLLQERKTPDKVLLKSGSEAFITQGNHQLAFGDGIDWEKWDSRVASSLSVAWQIFHLPYTSVRRLERKLNRKFYDKQKTTWRLNTFERNHAISPSRLFASAVISEKDRIAFEASGTIKFDQLFSDNLRTTIESLDEIWPVLLESEFSKSDLNHFQSSLDLNIVSGIVRKFFTKTSTLWGEKARHTEIGI